MKDETSDFLVIGTGPAAVAATHGLLSLGRKVTVIDAGLGDSSPSSAVEPSVRTRHHLKSYDGNFSDYALHPHSQERYDGIALARPSNFFGGFSRVWGATAHGDECNFGWPSSAVPTPVDVRLFNALMRVEPVSPSDFAVAARHQFETIESRDWTASGSYRALLVKEAIPDAAPCSDDSQTTGRYDYWQAAPIFRRWVSQGMVRLFDGHFVTEIVPQHDRTLVATVDRVGNGRVFEGRHIFLAAGPIGTAQILVRSRLLDRIKIYDTPTAFGGVAVFRRGLEEPNPGLQYAQWCVRDQREGYFAQVYDPSVSNEPRIRGELRIPKQFRFLSRTLATHLVPVVIYSSSTRDEYLEISTGGSGTEVRAFRSGEIRKRFGAAIRDLSSSFRKAGYIAGRGFFRIGRVGAGFHLGASLPMGLSTTELGSFGGLKRVHIVDSSVLPRLTAGPITSVVVLNSIRIARKVGALEI